MHESSVSLVICTRARPDDLRTALESIQSGSRQPKEIIVGDDGREEAVKIIANAFGAIYLEGPQRGLAANRNACVRAARGSHIMFIDDDVKLHNDTIAIAQRIACESIVTGWEYTHRTSSILKTHPRNADFLGFQTRLPTNGLSSIVINATIFPADVFTHCAFDEFSTYGYEELDIARHAVSHGINIISDDRLSVDHFPSSANREGQASAASAARLYMTSKAYGIYDRQPVKMVWYLFVASIHLLIQHKLDLHKSRQNIGTIWKALRARPWKFRCVPLLPTHSIGSVDD